MKTMKHIMLVEDEVELAELVRDYLEAAGFEVSMFHDGQDAYTQFQQRKLSLMILDLMVPRTDASPVCRTVGAQSDLPLLDNLAPIVQVQLHLQPALHASCLFPLCFRLFWKGQFASQTTQW